MRAPSKKNKVKNLNLMSKTGVNSYYYANHLNHHF
jgi:hypothetical protein